MATLQGASVPFVKADPDIKHVNGTGAIVNQEADLMDIPTADDDIYEDAGDLDFSNAARGLYLTRIPPYLWESWSQLDENEEIRLGTVRVEGSFDRPNRLSLLLFPDVARKDVLPAEYVLQVTDSKPANTFVFSEKDLPGYSSRQRASVPSNSGATVSAGSRLIHQGQRPHGIDKPRRGQGRKGIPKQTALAGRIKQEISCSPVDNVNYKQVMEKRAEEAAKKMKPKLELIEGLVTTASRGGTTALRAGASFDTFIKTNNKKAEKSQKLKAARIPQNELLDLIYNCFHTFEYWGMKALIQQLQQPAAYLKETLEIVAHLVRSGTYANNWQLKPDAKKGAYEAYAQAKAKKAPEEGLEGITDFEGAEDEEDEEMVDVLPP